jgi:ubiquinone/menaquinone biosynthesis C-methylase UbiE
MDHHEMRSLISGGIVPGGTWADLGAGEGNFTAALRDLLGPDAMIYAVDRDARALARLAQRMSPSTPRIIVRHADFTQPLDLPLLDGVLVANALHFTADHQRVIQHILTLLRPVGRLLVVEYDLTLPRPWVPHPLSFDRLSNITRQLGLPAPVRIAQRRSPSNSTVMYAALVKHDHNDETSPAARSVVQ